MSVANAAGLVALLQGGEHYGGGVAIAHSPASKWTAAKLPSHQGKNGAISQAAV